MWFVQYLQCLLYNYVNVFVLVPFIVEIEKVRTLWNLFFLRKNGKALRICTNSSILYPSIYPNRLSLSCLICMKPVITEANPAGNYLFKVNNRNTRTRCQICSKLTIKIPKRRQWRRSGIFIVNFEHISHLVLLFLLLTLSR